MATKKREEDFVYEPITYDMIIDGLQKEISSNHLELSKLRRAYSFEVSKTWWTRFKDLLFGRSYA